MSARVDLDIDARGDDVVISTSGSLGPDTLTGGSAADNLRSEVGRARLTGHDILIGGDGGDTYRVFSGDARRLTGPDGTPSPDTSVRVVEAQDGTGRDQLIWVGSAFYLRETIVEALDLRDLRSNRSGDRTPMEGTGSTSGTVIPGTGRPRCEALGVKIVMNPEIIELRRSGLAGDDTIIGDYDGQPLFGGEGKRSDHRQGREAFRGERCRARFLHPRGGRRGR